MQSHTLFSNMRSNNKLDTLVSTMKVVVVFYFYAQTSTFYNDVNNSNTDSCSLFSTFLTVKVL